MSSIYVFFALTTSNTDLLLVEVNKHQQENNNNM